MTTDLKRAALVAIFSPPGGSFCRTPLGNLDAASGSASGTAAKSVLAHVAGKVTDQSETASDK